MRTVCIEHFSCRSAPIAFQRSCKGFKKFEQSGVTLRAGHDGRHQCVAFGWRLAETITVTADSPLVDLAKIEQGRTMTEAEIKTLAADVAESLQLCAVAAWRGRV